MRHIRDLRLLACAAAAAMIAAVGLLGAAAATAAGPSVTPYEPQPPYNAGSPVVDVILVISKSIDTAARTGQANWGLRVTLTYVDVNNNVQVLDSGRKSIKLDTQLIESTDSQTDLIKLPLQFGSLPLPGNNATFSITAELLSPGS